MTNLNVQDPMESLSRMHDLQRMVCDLTAVKCGGQLRVQVQRQQGRIRDAVVISNPGNDRTLYLYLKPSGWQMAARKGGRTVWELALIGPTAAVAETVESRIEAFLLARPLYQSLLSNVKQGYINARHGINNQAAGKRYAAR